MNPDAGKPGRWMRAEIQEQPSVVARVIEREWRSASRLGRELRRRGIRFAVLAARGTSDHAATLGKYIFGSELGVPAALAAPSIATLYKREIDLTGSVVFGVSQSGRSTDILEYLRRASRSGAVTVAVTNAPDSPLARCARHVLLLHAGPERSVAATKTFTAQLACLYLAAAGWTGGSREAELLRELDRVPALIEAALASEEEALAPLELGAEVGRCAVIGRGFAYPIALETALKLKEAAGVFAEGASAADFLHGPIAMAKYQAEAGFRALLLLSRGPALPSMLRVERLLREAGVKSARLGPPLIKPLSRLGDPSDPRIPDLLSPFPLSAWGQLAAWRLAGLKGLDPDKPAGLSKVTRTR
jgi:glucosamine--fructose-6-phosphate aminotransferase (isomerizing)